MQLPIAKILIFTGVFFILAGVLYYFLGDQLRWLGRLPGDVRIERKNVRVYFPITTMILLSLLLTFILNVIRRFF